MTATPTHEAGHDPGRAELASATTSELISRLSTQMSELVRGELELARTELAEKGKRAGVGAGLAGAAGMVALLAAGTLVAAGVGALALVLPFWLSALIVGVVLLIVAGVLALTGRGRLKAAAPPVPEQAVDGVRDDVATVREAVHR